MPGCPQPLLQSSTPHVQVFYAACQAMLYVLCYRLDSLVSTSGDAAAMQALFSGPLQRIISHWYVLPPLLPA